MVFPPKKKKSGGSSSLTLFHGCKKSDVAHPFGAAASKLGFLHRAPVLMAGISAISNHRLDVVLTSVNNGINYQPQLVVWDVFHEQYY